MHHRSDTAAPTPWLTRPLAIIGMDCRLPGGDGLDAYWRLLADGRDATGPLPDSLLNRRLYVDRNKGVRGKSYSEIGGLVEPRELRFQRFAQRLGGSGRGELLEHWDECHLNFCEVAAAACEQAGYDPLNLPTRNVSVFVGHSGGSPAGGELAYRELLPELMKLLDEVPCWRELGVERQIYQQQLLSRLQAGRPQRRDGKPLLEAGFVSAIVSRAFDLNGPHLAIDAACASSLIALALGANSLQSGESEMAIVGGAAFNKADSLILFSHAQSCSATGSRPFDAAADGLVGSEGYVALVIKTLERAVADGDRIQAVIRGIGIASDGRGRSLWAPRSEGQLAAIERAYPRDVSPASIDLIEAHATSTQVGDATEVEALTIFYKQYIAPEVRIPVGSVKSNIGHTLETAGLAGLLKMVLAIQHATMPPSIHVRQLNPTVDWEATPLEVLLQKRAWPKPADGTPRRGAVNAFGIGGLNVHVVVEEFSDTAHATHRLVKAGELRSRPVKSIAAEDWCDEPIAIIGRGVVLPGALNLAALEQLLRAPQAQFQLPAFERLNDRLAGYITDFQYDWRRHKVPPKQIAQANPLQFMLLDAAEQALQEAGLTPEKLDRRMTAVVVGSAFGGDFGNALYAGLRLPEFRQQLSEVLQESGLSWENIERIYQEYEQRFLTCFPALLDETGSFTSSTLASRLTKSLDLMGGALAVDAGDCSGLAGVNVACQLLRGRAVSHVLAAAAQRSLDRVAWQYAEQCGGDPQRGLGEGVSLVVLKRELDARRDGNSIFGIITQIDVGFAIDDRGAALHAVESKVVERARISGASPRPLLIDSTGYVGSRETIQQACPTHKLQQSTLLPSTGYLQSVQGMADLIGETVKPAAMPVSGLGVEMQTSAGETETVPLERTIISQTVSGQCYAASLQINTHQPSDQFMSEPSKEALVSNIEHVPRQSSESNAVHGTRVSLARDDVGTEPEDYRLVRFEAESLAALAERLQAAAREPQRIGNFATWEEAGKRPQLAPQAAWRAAIVARPGELAQRCEKLHSQLGNQAARGAIGEQGMFWGQPAEQIVAPTIAWMFPGQGSQRVGMLRELAHRDSSAKALIAEADDALRKLGQPTFAELAWGTEQRLGGDVWQTQAAMLIGDALMQRVLASRGLGADVVCGHSFGEFAALLAAGCWDLETALQATWHRCQAIVGHVSQVATMLGVQAERGQVERLIAASGLPVHLSHVNAPQQMVVGGARAAVEAFHELCTSRQVECRLLSVPTAFHTPVLRPAVEPFRQSLEQIALSLPRTACMSSVTNEWYRSESGIRAALAEQLVTPIDFVATLERLRVAGVQLMVEVGPGQVLTRLIRQSDQALPVIATDNVQRGAIFQVLCMQGWLEVVCLRSNGMSGGRPLSTKHVTHTMHVGETLSFDATRARRERMRRIGRSIMPGEADAPGRLVVSPPVLFDATEKRRSEQRQHAIQRSMEVSAPRATPSGDQEALIAQFLIDFVVEQTGYPPEIIELDWDMEADLGIDSIKRAQLFGELREFFDLDAEGERLRLDEFRSLRDIVKLLVRLPGKGEWLTRAASEVTKTNDSVELGAIGKAANDVLVHPTPQEPAGLLPGQFEQRELIQQFLIDFVVEHTGYPAEVVEIEADLEADLGIDSIKKTQLLGELRDTLGSNLLGGGMNLATAGLGAMQGLAHIRTLGDILRTMLPADSSLADDPAVKHDRAVFGVMDEAASPEVRDSLPRPLRDSLPRPLREMPLKDRLLPNEEHQRNNHQTVVHSDSIADGIFVSRVQCSVHGDCQVSESYRNVALNALRCMVGRASGSETDEASPSMQVVQEEKNAGWLERLSVTLGVDSRALRQFEQLVARETAWRLMDGNCPADAVMDFGEEPVEDVVWLAELQLPAWLRDVETPMAVADMEGVLMLSVAGAVDVPFALAVQDCWILPIGTGKLHFSQQKVAIHEVLARLNSMEARGLEAVVDGLCHNPLGDGDWLVVNPASLRQATICQMPDGPRVEYQRTEAGKGRLRSSSSIAMGLNVELRQIRLLSANGATFALPMQPIASRVGESATLEVEGKAVYAESRTIAESATVAESITQRYVLKLVPAPLRQAVNRRNVDWAGAALIVGDNPVARHLEGRLLSSGVAVTRLAAANDPQWLAQQFERMCVSQPVPHLFLTSPLDQASRTTGRSLDWQRRLDAGLMGNFWLCQRWNTHVQERGLVDDASLAVVTALGGDFGLSGQVYSAEGGGLAGLLKSMLIENWMQGMRTLRVKVVDTRTTDVPADVVNRLWEELANPNYDTEVAFRPGGERLALRAFKQPLNQSAALASLERRSAISSASKPLPRLVEANGEACRPRYGGNWVFTGGGRGITAYVAEQLGVRYGLKLHLLGTSPTPSIDPAWHELDERGLLSLKAQIMSKARSAGRNAVKAWQNTEKSIEIDATLNRLRSRGLVVHYHPCDVADMPSLTRTLAKVRELSGPIDGVVHGAGVGRDARFDRKQPDKVRQCIAAKVDGAFNLFEATGEDPLQYFIGFGSISGRFGANGHADYSLANEMLCKQIDWLQTQRPKTKCLGFHWHAWGDIGMATKPETKLALEMIQMQFMPAAEGLQHLIHELEGGQVEREVLITDERYLRMYYPTDNRGASGVTPTMGGENGVALIDGQVEPRKGGERAYRVPVDPRADRFLSEHLLHSRPLLPIVMAAEMFLEAASIELRTRELELFDLRALSGLRFFNDDPRDLIVETSQTKGGRLQCGLHCDFTSRDGRLVEAMRAHFSASVVASSGVAELALGDRVALSGSSSVVEPWRPVVYPEVGSMFWGGPSFRRFRRYRLVEDGLIGRIAAPALIELAGPLRDTRGWLSPSAAIDACLFAAGILAWARVRPMATLPVRIGRLSVRRLPHPGESCEVHVRLLPGSEEEPAFSMTLYGIDGEVICHIEDYRVMWLDGTGQRVSQASVAVDLP